MFALVAIRGRSFLANQLRFLIEPEFGSGEFDAIVGGIAAVQRMSATGPADFRFNGDPVFSEVLFDLGELIFGYFKSKVRAAAATMLWNHVATDEDFFGPRIIWLKN
jgi:hypothetical protein